jgi:guanyl-specific ribonuclease Sa
VSLDREREDDASRTSRPPEAVAEPSAVVELGPAVASVLALQRSMGNQAVQRLLRPADHTGALLQRRVLKAGGKGAVDVSAEAKSVARWVMTKASVQPGGSNHIADIQGRGFPGFKMYKAEYAGGRAFNNNAQPDHNKLPYIGGQTYQEWDTMPCVAGQGRGADRVVTSSDGKAYYSNDHYANFTEFTP